MPQTLVIFDWNGTLLDDMPAWYRSVRAIFHAFTVDPPTLEECCAAGSLSAIYRDHGITAPWDELNSIYAEAYRKEISHLGLVPGTREALKELHRRDVILALISAQIPELFTPVFECIAPSYLFAQIECGVTDKAACIAELVASFAVHEPVTCFSVGDAPSDVHAARRACATPIAYLNGYIPASLFSAIEPAPTTFRRFSDLPDLIT